MKKLYLLVFLAIAVSACSGCAFKVYVGPGSGRSAEYQLAVSKSVEEAFKDVEFKDLKGKKVYVETSGLAQKASDLSAEEGYVRSEIFQKLFKAGAEPVTGLENADARISARLRITGIDIVERHLPGIYYRVSVRGVTSARLVIYDVKEKRILDSLDANGIIHYTEVYWMYFLGPYRSIEPVEDAGIYAEFWKKKENIEEVEEEEKAGD